MRPKEKKEQILRWWDEGRIRKVGNGYSVPVDAFIMGITPRMVDEVLRDKQEKEVNSEPATILKAAIEAQNEYYKNLKEVQNG